MYWDLKICLWVLNIPCPTLFNYYWKTYIWGYIIQEKIDIKLRKMSRVASAAPRSHWWRKIPLCIVRSSSSLPIGQDALIVHCQKNCQQKSLLSYWSSLYLVNWNMSFKNHFVSLFFQTIFRTAQCANLSLFNTGRKFLLFWRNYKR